MKILKKNQLKLVKPKFRKMVKIAWKNGEDVPFGVTMLSSAPVNKKDLDWVKQLVKEGKILDN